MASSTTSAIYQELGTRGIMDEVLTSPTLTEDVRTPFRFVHTKTTVFAISVEETSASSSTVKFGATNVKYVLSKSADLYGATFAKITLPGIIAIRSDETQAVDPANEVYWTNAAAQFALKQIDLTIANSLVGSLRNYMLYVTEEMTGKPGKRLSEMVGRYDTEAMRQKQSRRSRIFYVPLPFFFNAPHLALPACSIQFQSITFTVQFSPLNQCICYPAGFTPTGYKVFKRVDGASNASHTYAASTVLADTDLECSLEHIVYQLDDDERTRFSTGRFSQIITQTQYHEEPVSKTITSGTITESTPSVWSKPSMTLAHVITHYVFVVRRLVNETANDWFNFAGRYDTITESSLDPVKSFAVKFGANYRVEKRPGQFFRQVIPRTFGSRNPDEFMYMWSYATVPESDDFSGGMNHSRIENIVCEFELDAYLFDNDSSTATILFMAHNKNFISYTTGFTNVRFG
jgi:hypothetical protein